MPSVENDIETDQWELQKMLGTSTYNDYDKQRAEEKARQDKLVYDLEQLKARVEKAEQQESFKPKPLRDKLKWVGVDLDGTLAYPLWTPDNPTSEIGDPIPEALSKVDELVSAGYKVIVHTSRPWTDYQIIEQWLLHYNIPFKEIQCGKPLYAAYIDDRAIHSEEVSWLPK